MDWYHLSSDEKRDWIDDEVTQALVRRLRDKFDVHIKELLAAAEAGELPAIRYARGKIRCMEEVIFIISQAGKEEDDAKKGSK